MWRFKHFGHKEPTGLEGRSIDVGNLKIHVRNAIAEGGFSCVYLAKDAIHMSKQYALKHIICNDEESLELVIREISVMKLLQGHPNVVTLHAHSILDLGRVKEALLVMELCEKSLVNVIESRGAGYFDEKQILSIFRDVCNAVFAMHCQSPPIAHRDLKAENLLVGPNGSWKLCDFGSTSTNHKRFEKPEEMGIEEDNIRKQTTPAYRAPEMWDLFRREMISEKVDIWALGCLLFRICYFKSAFDGESKLQILNGNYRIPDLPKYSSSITDLIRDMLRDSPHDRPDITQVWFRVNEQLPAGLQKSVPDRPPGIQSSETNDAGIVKSANKSPPMPRRSPPPVPSYAESTRNSSQASHSSSIGSGGGGQLGAFWSTQHAKNSLFDEEKNRPKFDEEVQIHSDNHFLPKNLPSLRDGTETTQFHSIHGHTQSKAQKDFIADSSKPGNMPFEDNVFNSFVAEFDTEKFISMAGDSKAGKEAALEAEVERLKEQLKQTNSEKTEITSKFEKLSAICRSQRQEIQELKQALAAKTPQNKVALKNETPPMLQPSITTSRREKDEGHGRVLEQHEENSDWSASSIEQKQWQACAEGPNSQLPLSSDKAVKSVRTRNSEQKKQVDQVNSSFNSWGFGSDSFTAAPATNPNLSSHMDQGNGSQRFGESKIMENKPALQPAGWAGF